MLAIAPLQDESTFEQPAHMPAQVGFHPRRLEDIEAPAVDDTDVATDDLEDQDYGTSWWWRSLSFMGLTTFGVTCTLMGFGAGLLTNLIGMDIDRQYPPDRPRFTRSRPAVAPSTVIVQPTPAGYFPDNGSVSWNIRIADGVLMGNLIATEASNEYNRLIDFGPVRGGAKYATLAIRAGQSASIELPAGIYAMTVRSFGVGQSLEDNPEGTVSKPMAIDLEETTEQLPWRVSMMAEDGIQSIPSHQKRRREVSSEPREDAFGDRRERRSERLYDDLIKKARTNVELESQSSSPPQVEYQLEPIIENPGAGQNGQL